MDKKIKILFIDREHGEYLLIADILSQVRHVEYQLTWCNQLEAALPKILSQDYDVVLLDYYWGGSSARDLLNAARGASLPNPHRGDDRRDGNRSGSRSYPCRCI